jgi:hypothetical protein
MYIVRQTDFDDMRDLKHGPTVFEACNIYDVTELYALKFLYQSSGRPVKGHCKVTAA